MEDISCKFNGYKITMYKQRVGKGFEGYFKVSDIGHILHMKNINSTIRNYDDSEISIFVENDKLVKFLTIFGTYRLRFRAKNPIPKDFDDWLDNIIYEIKHTDIIRLQKQIKMIEEREEEIKNLEQKNQKIIKRIKDLEEENQKTRNEIEMWGIEIEDLIRDSEEI